jgi:2-oxoisovalerate dehydrogenase E2 component (dihydrolipoyl transacylase)
MRTQPPGVRPGQPEQLKGVRRNMARVMADAHAQGGADHAVRRRRHPCLDAGNDITVRLMRAIVRACKAVPALNAWFDGDKLTRTLHPHVDIGIAVDTDDGLFVPALRNADVLDAARHARSGQPPARAGRGPQHPGLVGALRLHHLAVQLRHVRRPLRHAGGGAALRGDRRRRPRPPPVVPVMGGIERTDHPDLADLRPPRRTGGEAARFLRALLDDLAPCRRSRRPTASRNSRSSGVAYFSRRREAPSRNCSSIRRG